jgi:hypothetical protein
MRAFIEIFSRQARRCGEKSRMAPHNHADQYAGKGAIVQVQANEGLGYKSRRGTESWTVIIEHKIIVDRFWNMDGAEFIAGFLGLLVDDSHGVG